MLPDLQRERFLGTIDGRAVDLFFLRHERMQAAICSYGAKVVQLIAPARDGALSDVALGYESLEALVQGQWALGAFVGRYANRIAQARFELEGREVRLAANDGPHSLHGGPRGSFARVFEASQGDPASVDMRYTFADGEEGFPGILHLFVRYRLGPANCLSVSYVALAEERATVANLTTHTFFNLGGHASGEVLGHELQILAPHFLPIDAGLIPTGELRSVRGTPMDFLEPCPIGARIGAADEQLGFARGYDHHFVLDPQARRDGAVKMAARVEEPRTRRAMQVWTTEPGMQLYSGNFIDGSRPRDVGKGGVLYRRRSAFCLEPSRFPDSPHHANFPSTVLRPGERYSGETQYRFEVGT